jgi:hypothetical protein
MSSQIIAENVGFDRQDEVDRVEIDILLRLNGRVRDLRLLLYTDGLVLLGRAATFHAKQLAQHAVMAATRLPILANDIEVCSDDLDAQLLDFVKSR